MMKFFDLKSGNVSSLLAAVIVGFLALGYQNYAQEKARVERIASFKAERVAKNAEPIENWVVQGDIYIPDFIQGDDVMIINQREPIKRPYASDWSVSVITLDTAMIDVCDISGSKVYGVGETLPVAGTSMKSMFSPRPCNLEAGKYVMRMEWVIRRQGYDNAMITRTSNPFNVLPKGAQLYLEPEQVQKLENVQ